MELLKGIDVANAINEKLIKEGADMGGRVPKLAIIRVGERPDDMSYERGATKKMEKVGFACESFVFPETIENGKPSSRRQRCPDTEVVCRLIP